MVYNQVMSKLSEREAIQKAVDMLCVWLDCEPSQITYESWLNENQSQDSMGDAGVTIKDIQYLIEYKESGDLGSVMNGVRYLSKVKSSKKKFIRILVVPYMHEPGRKHCEESKISWLDLSGNANITGPGIRIIIEDQPNLYKRPGRSSSVFARKSSRVTRFLLYNRLDTFSQRELALQADLDEGYVSKIVRSLETLEFITRDENGRITNQDPNVLLDAWLEKYDFSKHYPIRGYIPARSGQSLMQQISDALIKERIEYAVTGLGAAWLYTHFASFRAVTIYIDENIGNELLSYLDYSESDIGFNTIIAKPNDPSILWRLNEIDGIQCVHPIQAYLDLKGQPERAKEAMPELRQHINREYFK